MSEFFKAMFANGGDGNISAADKADADRAMKAASHASQLAINDIFDTIDDKVSDLSDARKVFVMMVAAHMVLEKVRASLDHYEQSRGEEMAEPIRKMWGNVSRIFAMTREERRDELRKHRDQ